MLIAHKKVFTQADVVSGVITLETECHMISVRNADTDPATHPLIIHVDQSSLNVSGAEYYEITVTDMPISEIRLAPFKQITIMTQNVNFYLVVERALSVSNLKVV